MGREKVSGTWLKCRSLGSPPRGRGKGQLSVGHQIRERITSAWAGKSSWTKAISTRTLDHPPRWRGKDFHELHGVLLAGITPAWAGKSYPRPPCFSSRQDHPRVGGEKVCRSVSRSSMWGSPPRGRGKATGIEVPVSAERITPAWAGKSGDYSTAGSSGKDHPRVGGEKIHWLSFRLFRTGSPPRGRGKVPYPQRGPEVTRITPAWAGKSRLLLSSLPTA